MKKYYEIRKWLRCISHQSQLKVTSINFQDSHEWFLNKNELVHKTKHFFKVIGVRWIHYETKKNIITVLIDQREIGVLGFLVLKQQNTNKILIQAKVEPGNIGQAQLSPTCQATASNIETMHGGLKPPFSDIFMQSKFKVLSSTLQSENGSNFYKKRNRNVVLITNKNHKHSKSFKWIDIDNFLPLLGKDLL